MARLIGRPTRAQAAAKALARLDEAALMALDPLLTLRQIMADTSAPAAARVTAAKALLAHGAAKDSDGEADDRLTATTLRLMRGGRK